ncbi:MAG: WD40 repeat domain-containing protein [Rhodobacterales bacterium]|nr:WD40 repeat domain-containing protein [Rhodobacterales bacterium]
MTAAAEDTADAGVRVVSPSVGLAETPAVGVHPTFALVEAARNRAVVGFGDGSLRALPLTPETTGYAGLAAVDGVPLVAARDLDGGLLIGTDGAGLVALRGEALAPVAAAEGWINALAVHPGAGLRAFAADRRVTVLDGTGQARLTTGEHDSTVAGLAFSPDGAWIAAAHYGGVLVWATDDPRAAPVRLDWHGSHTVVSWSPDGRFIVTAMQDKEMHAWRWQDRKSLRMSGYPSKIRALSWTADGRYLAASGADTVTSWDCSGQGPMGRAPLEFGYVYNGTVRQVAAHPERLLVAGGYSDGTILIGRIEQETAVIARPSSGAPVVALDWSPDGRRLVGVDEAGAAAVMHLRDAALA